MTNRPTTFTKQMKDKENFVWNSISHNQSSKLDVFSIWTITLSDLLLPFALITP